MYTHVQLQKTQIVRIGNANREGFISIIVNMLKLEVICVPLKCQKIDN
jgi:hypothetical protein